MFAGAHVDRVLYFKCLHGKTVIPLPHLLFKNTYAAHCFRIMLPLARARGVCVRAHFTAARVSINILKTTSYIVR